MTSYLDAAAAILQKVQAGIETQLMVVPPAGRLALRSELVRVAEAFGRLETYRAECGDGEIPADFLAAHADAVHAAAAGLLARIKRIEQPDGTWPGAGVVDILTGWFTDLGFDIEAPADGGDPE